MLSGSSSQYAPIAGEDYKPTRTWGRTLLAFCVAIAGLVAVPSSVKKSAVRSLYNAGHVLETAGASADGTSPMLAAQQAECACDCEIDMASLMAEDITEAPTTDFYWELFWTDGTGSQGLLEVSYVWTTTAQLSGISATVLVDTLGTAKGIDVDQNATALYFTAGGCLGKVERDGMELKEILCYTDDVTSSDMRGLAIHDFANKIYWVDYDLDTLFETSLLDNDGTYSTLYTDFSSPIDVAVDETAGKLYVTDAAGIYKMNLDTSGISLVLDTTDFATYQGIDIDATNRDLYFVAESGVYSASIFDLASHTALYTGLSAPMGVAVDGDQGLLFFTSSHGVYEGTTDGSATSKFVAEIDDARFICVLSEAAPTPAPTPVPTPAPSHTPSYTPSYAPTSIPTAVPSPKPSYMPSPAPTPIPTLTPTAAPSSAPSRAPTLTPTLIPTAVPSYTPTYTPTTTPTGLPTALPTPAPTSEPSPSPTSMPTSICFKEMNDCGYCDDTPNYECTDSNHAPTSQPIATPGHFSKYAPTSQPVTTNHFPTYAPTISGLCDGLPDGWKVISGEFNFDRTYLGNDCVMESNDTEACSIYTDIAKNYSDSKILATYSNKDSSARNSALYARIDHQDTYKTTTSFDDPLFKGYSCVSLTGDPHSELGIYRLLGQGKSENLIKGGPLFGSVVDTWYTLKFDVTGNTLTCAIYDADGKLLNNITATDDNYASGYVGIGANKDDYGHHYYKNVEGGGTPVR